MPRRSAKGRKETKERKKEKRTKGRRIPWGIVRDPPGGGGERNKNGKLRTKGREAGRWRWAEKGPRTY